MSPSPAGTGDEVRTEVRNGYRIALGGYLLWGIAPLYWHFLGDVPSLQLTAYRVLLTVPLVVALVLWWRRGSVRALFADRRLALVHLGAATLLAVNWLIFIYAIATERTVEASLGYFINPLLSVLLGVLVLRERLSRLVGVAVALAVVGVGVLTWDAGSLPWISLVLASSFAVYGLVRKQSDLGSIEGLTVEVLWLLPPTVVFVVVLAANGTLTIGSGLTPLALLFIGAVTAVPLMLFAEGARRIPLWTVGLLQYVAPTLQFIVGVFVFGETVSAGWLTGMAIVWVALVIFATSSVRSARQAAPA